MPYANKEEKKAHHRAYMKERYQNDPIHREKQRIRSRTGKIKKKPTECQVCKGPSPEGHHPDIINQPKMIEWLCRDCHRSQHPNEC